MVDLTDPKLLQDWIAAAKSGVGTVAELAGLFEKLKNLLGKGQSSDGAKPSSLEVRDLIIELSEKVVAMREEALTHKDRIATLAEELSRIQQFVADRENYLIVELQRGSYAYRRKDAGKTIEPTPDKCAHCFEQSKRIVTLQLKKRDFGTDTLACPACGGEVFKDNDVRMEVRTAGRWRNPMDDFTI